MQDEPTMSQRNRSPVGRAAASIWGRFLRLGFGLLYNQMAWSYDLVSWLVSRGQWRMWQRAAIPYLCGATVLELAHGPGHMLLALEEAGFKVVGLDLSRSMGRLAGQKAKRAHRSFALVRGDGKSLPFRRQAFDSAMSTFPTEFLASQETIYGIYGILKPGGRLVVVPQARLTGGGGVSRFIEWLYSVTGQRPPESNSRVDGFWQLIGDRFRAAGFQLSLELVHLETSEVTVVVAEKPATAE